MKSIRIHHFGGPEQIHLENTPQPQIGPKQLLIEVHDAGVNPIDWKIRQNFYKQMNDSDLPMTLGQDIAGIVVGVGSGVTGLAIGDRVFGFADDGGYAEFAVADQNSVAVIPAGVDFKTAASLPTAALTAWQTVVDTAHVGQGMSVLIQGAAGGVGSFAAQLCKWRGARVIATAASEDFGYLKSIAVDEVIDYKDLDVVVDLVGGEVTALSMRVVKKGGIIISTTHTIKEDEARALGIRGVNIMMKRDALELETLGRLVAEGVLKSRVSQVLPLEKAAEAQEINQRGHSRGKLVLEVMR
jgi:NADPH:quinone reductase-like Zn-dependent oxidoreductase